MARHEHRWTWQWFGETPAPKSYLAALRTCECGAFEEVRPGLGHTPKQAALEAENEAKRERRRAQMRERNRKSKERQTALAAVQFVNAQAQSETPLLESIPEATPARELTPDELAFLHLVGRK